MESDRIEGHLARLNAAVDRLVRAGERLAGKPAADLAELAGLQERHSLLKQSVAQSLRQLDDILGELPK